MNEGDFTDFLREELLKRCKRNPSYSLRAFAKSMGSNHAIVSMILNGKRRLTPAMVTNLGSALGLPAKEIDRYLMTLETGGPVLSSKQIKIKEMNQLTLDSFHLVTEWYHDAIMELILVDGANVSSKYVSKALGISIGEAHSAIERLTRLDLIRVNSDKTCELAGHFTTINEKDRTSPALRALQRKLLELSAESVNEVPIELRDHSSITLSIRKKDLKDVKGEIKAFRRKLMAFLQREDGGKFDDVYCLSVSFFPLTKFYKKES